MQQILDLGIIQVVLASRPPLHRLTSVRGPEALALWVVDKGFDECPELRQDRELREFLAGPFGDGGATRLEALLYSCRAPAPVAREWGTPRYREWCARYAAEELHLRDITIDPEVGKPGAQRPFGVNVIGYAFHYTGLGEEARMAAMALQAAGIPFTLVDAVDTAPGAGERSMENFVTGEAPYAFNLLCLPANGVADWYLRRAATQCAGRFNINQAWWEMEKWPREWLHALRLVDEIWAPSRFILDGLRKASGVHCEYMPSAVELGEVRERTRADFGLPSDAYLFFCSFDPKSFVARKNPAAAIAAFQAAFPIQDGERVGLVIKTQFPKEVEPWMVELKGTAAADPRIRMIEATFERPDLLALYKACDCYVSLHRSEGFGRNIAEAMLLGRQVVATDYGGNTDFCREPHAFPVRWDLVPVKPGEYIVDCGGSWAEPDIGEAAAAMRRAMRSPPPPPLGRVLPGRSVETIGAAYAARLRTLHAQLQLRRDETTMPPTISTNAMA